MKTLFVLTRTSFDLTSIFHLFDQVKYVTGHEYGDKENRIAMMQDMQKAADEFDVATDAVILNGNPCAAAIFAHELMTRTTTRFPIVARWVKHKRQYDFEPLMSVHDTLSYYAATAGDAQ